jgi:hypothetical protein
MIYCIDWIENELQRHIQFNCKDDCLDWCMQYAPELLEQLRSMS